MNAMGDLKRGTVDIAAGNNAKMNTGFEESLQRAVSLQETGFLDKAVLEYETLLKTDCPLSKGARK